jgi:hypothetical protein
MAREATHRVCEDHQRLDVGVLSRGGLLTCSGTLTWSGGSGVAIDGCGDSVTLTYAVDGKKVQERVSISKTSVHLGGHRSWFICPGCDRRIAALYFAGNFRCRHCHDLRYRSQRETLRHRAISRIQRARQKLTGSRDLTQPIPTRPRYMHNVTYQRLVREETDAWQAYVSTG